MNIFDEIDESPEQLSETVKLMNKEVLNNCSLEQAVSDRNSFVNLMNLLKGTSSDHILNPLLEEMNSSIRQKKLQNLESTNES